ncbi:MAG TPA: MmgE/PrpD family protein [Aliidongia sp.]|nr:MmgE/PrpD family protein [Aliidongia sp.]
MTSPYIGEVLGHFVAQSRWEEIAPALRHEGRRSLLNFFSGPLGVVRNPAVETAIEVMRPFSGPEKVTVIGRPERLDAMGAAFVNAIAANLLDYDDTHLRTIIHPTAPVAPPILALAEQYELSGAAVLHAFLLGAEIECRIGNAVSPGHYARGWHITSTCGVFGAAAACGKLLGLTAEEIWSALGIAASQSAGLVENLASAAKNVGMGNAARNGLLAALLARAGYGAAPAALEGPLGWARAMGDVPKLEAILGRLGESWEIAANTYKPYPSGIVFHSVIDACLDLRARLGGAVSDIATVTVRGDRLLLDRGDRPVRNERDARVSIHHSAAIAFVRGRAGVPEFEADAVTDPGIAAFRGKVRAECDPAMPTGAASVTVETKGGRVETLRVDHARGSAERPLSDAELEAKFRANAELGGSVALADERIERIWRLDEETSLRPLMRSMAGA